MLTPHPIRSFPGLFGSTNPYDLPPEGSSEIDQDTVRRSRGIPEPRRGYKASASVAAPINAIAFKQGQLVALTYDTPQHTGALRLYNPATDAWSTLAMNPGGLALDRPGIATSHTRFVSANKALYFQSRYGYTKIEDIATGVCRAALQPQEWTKSAIPGFGAPGWGASVTANVAAGSWLANGSQVVYRFTLARFGANRELIESEPSERVAASNTSGIATGVSVSPEYGWMQSPDMFFRVWRSKQVPNGSDASDELFLVFELPPLSTATLDATGYIQKRTQSPSGSVSDATFDTSLYVPLYTNPYSGVTIAQANTPAVLSADIAWFKNRMHFLNTQDVQRLTIKIIGTGSTGVSEGSQIAVGPYKFTFSASGIGAITVPLLTGGTVAQNIENTARALVQTANNNEALDSNALYSGGQLQTALLFSYLSATSTDAGQILVQSLVPGAAAFTVKTSQSAGWDRDYTGGTTSDPNTQAAGWMWSAFGQPEGVPTANNDLIGDPTAAGQAFVALKETLFAFKQDGLWKITDDGSTAGPVLQLMDPTVHLTASRTAVALDNMIFALCDQGIVMITETGAVTNISHLQIERDLFKLMAYVGNTALQELAFGVAYQPEHTFILSLPESPNATACTKQYVYNLQSQAWTSWSLPGGVLCGAVNPDTGQLYFGRPDGTLLIERKNYDNTDYQDPGFTISSPTAAQTASLVFSGDLRTGATPFAAGDLVQQFQSVNALRQRVLAVSYNSTANQTTVTLDNTPRYAWNQVAPLTIVKAIQARSKLLPITAGEPLTDKDWGDCYLSFRYCDLDFISVGWSSEKYLLTTAANPVQERVNDADGSDAPIQLQKWGSGAWGSTVWGRQAKDVVLKCSLPQDFGYSAQLTLDLIMPCALNRFELSALDVKIAGGTDKVVR